jgi:hypothetical protein
MYFPVAFLTQGHKITNPVIILRPPMSNMVYHRGLASTGITSDRLARILVPHASPLALVFRAWALFFACKVWVRPWMPFTVLFLPLGLWFAISILI